MKICFRRWYQKETRNKHPAADADEKKGTLIFYNGNRKKAINPIMELENLVLSTDDILIAEIFHYLNTNTNSKVCGEWELILQMNIQCFLLEAADMNADLCY